MTVCDVNKGWMKVLDRFSRILGLSLAAAAFVILPGTAGAATQLGQVSPGDPSAAGSGNFAQLQTASIAYAVPFPGGVITGWSHRGDNGSAGSGRLQVWRQLTMNDFNLVGSSSLQTFNAGVVNFFLTRISVIGGELLGFRADGAGAGYSSGSGSDVLIQLSGGDPAPGETRMVTAAAPNLLVNVSAILEPDADGDAFGDETQDQCPGQAGSASGCPPPPAAAPTAVPTGQRAATLKKCKKQFKKKLKKKNLTKKRKKKLRKKFKKCKKKARRLPV